MADQVYVIIKDGKITDMTGNLKVLKKVIDILKQDPNNQKAKFEIAKSEQISIK